jgi:hypothetical protein
VTSRSTRAPAAHDDERQICRRRWDDSRMSHTGRSKAGTVLVMWGTAGRTARGRPIAHFKPTNGLVAGWAGLALVALVVAYAALQEHSQLGVRLVLGAALAGVLTWVTQLRPRVTAYPDALLVHGTISDVTIPYVLVDEVTMGQTLNVWARGRRYVCVGIGRSVGYDVRQKFRAQRSGGLLGENRTAGFAAESGRSGPTYQSFVLSRILDLVAEARRAGGPSPEPEVRKQYAVPELVVLAVTGAAFVVSLLR